jgi:S1-C subfamily serine protease
VSLEGRSNPGGGGAPLLVSTTTGADGRFELSGLGAGLRSITVVAEGHHGRIVSGLAVAEGGDVGPITVELAKTEEGEEPRIELTGIGAVLSAKDDGLIVGQVLPGGGAAEAGLQPGDVLIGVDGFVVTEIGFEQAIQRIRGPEGSTVALVVRRAAGGEPVEVVVTRRRIQRP